MIRIEEPLMEYFPSPFTPSEKIVGKRIELNNPIKLMDKKDISPEVKIETNKRSAAVPAQMPTNILGDTLKSKIHPINLPTMASSQ